MTLLACAPASTTIVKYDWDGNPQVVGPCFKVHGRMSQYNGGTSFRIWKIGTHRMLGVANEVDPPKELLDKFRDFDTEVYGDFLVCPLTTEQPGHMQMVCVQSVKNAVVRQRK